MSSSTLCDLLCGITLPALSTFDVSCTAVDPSSSVDFPTIKSFLTRHPLITTLCLGCVIVPHKFAALKEAILPRLLNLAAHSDYVAWLLGPQDALPQIQSVTILIEYQWADVAFDHNPFDEAIRLVASITREVVFGIRFVSNPRMEDWLQKHVDAGRKGSIIALLNRVKELKICCSYHVEFSPSTLTVLVGFLALFPELERVHFVEPRRKLEDLMLEQAFFESVASESPNIRTIQVNGSSPRELCSLTE